MPLHVNEESFRKEVLECDKPVLVDFWATWCGPCMMLGPTIEEVEKERTDIKVVKVDIDESPNLAASLHIQAVPTVMVFRKGKVAAQTMGVRPKEQLFQLIEIANSKDL